MGKADDWEEVLVDVDDQIAYVSAHEALDALIGLRDEINVRIDGLKDDIRRENDDE